MRVLHVTPAYYPASVYGGPIHSLRGLCGGLREAGCDVRVLTTDAHGPGRSLDRGGSSEVDGIPVRYCRRIAFETASGELLRELRHEARWADVMHLTGVYNFPTFPTLLVARRLNIPLMWSLRGALQPWPGRRREAVKQGWNAACRAFAPPALGLHVTSALEAAASKPSFPQGRFFEIPNGVDLEEVVDTDEGDPSCRLLFLGRLHEVKAIDRLLEAVALVRSRGTVDPLRLVIAGSGDPAYESALRRLVEKLSLGDAVRFAGHLDREARRAAFARADVTVLPSHTENFGMVVAESLAHGRPVIASTRTPWQGLVDHDCGMWVSNEVADLAQAIEVMAGRDLESMGRRGRAWMARDFSWSSIGRKMAAAYRELLAARDSTVVTKGRHART